MTSTKAVDTVEAELDSFLADHGVDYWTTWSWGYEMGMPEPHRWDAGVLYGYWLCLPKEYNKVKPILERASLHLQKLDIVASVDTAKYEEDLSSDPLLGEQWAISFVTNIFYDHRREEVEQY